MSEIKIDVGLVCTICQLIVVVLKLTGHIAFSWWLVFIPEYLYLVSVFFGIIFGVIAMKIVHKPR